MPAEIVVYTKAEWERLRREGGRFARMLDAETVWLVAARILEDGCG